MPFPVGAQSPVQAHLGTRSANTQESFEQDVLLQSRETGEVVPEVPEPVKETGQAKVKPLAHFFAGGYVM